MADPMTVYLRRREHQRRKRQPQMRRSQRSSTRFLKTGSIVHTESHLDQRTRCSSCSNASLMHPCSLWCGYHDLRVGASNWCVHFEVRQ